jgi:hypothetical protein
VLTAWKETSFGSGWEDAPSDGIVVDAAIT